MGRTAKKRQPMPSAAASMGRLFFFPDHRLDILFRLVPGCHYLMAAAEAFQPEIRTGAQDFPLFLATGVCFLHYKDVIQLNVHEITPS